MHFTAIDDAAWASPWRQRRVGEKVALSLALVVTALITPPFPGCLLVAVAATLFIVVGARIRLRHLLYALSAPLVFIAIGACTLAVAVGDVVTDPWWHWGPFSMNAQTVAQAVDVSAHAVAGTLAVMLLATTTPMVDLLTWMHRLRIPAPLLEIASLTYRLVFVVLSVAWAVRSSQVARLGDRPGRGWRGLRRQFDVVGLWMSAVLVRSWDRAARLTRGMELRGFDGALVTTAAERRASWKLMSTGAATIAGIWAVVWWCT